MNLSDLDQDIYSGICACCGRRSEYVRTQKSIRESYSCGHCKSSLRYRLQAQAIVDIFGFSKHSNLNDLAKSPEFDSLSIYEPGLSGPFRKLFSNLSSYTNSFYWDDIEEGGFRDGVQCQNLERLNYDNEQFDLIISSDIMEHVRRPWDAFKEIYRVLKPGGVHVFSIPVQIPMPSKCVMRVDTTRDEDIHIAEPHYHGNGIGGRSLVYIDYGLDLVNHLMDIGYDVSFQQCQEAHASTHPAVTLVTKKKK